MNIREIKIKFLKEVEAPQAVWRTRCDCCGPQFEGWQKSWFYNGEEIDPNEQYHQVDLRNLVLGIDYAITHLVFDQPDTY
jgi:hypothetical protein